MPRKYGTSLVLTAVFGLGLVQGARAETYEQVLKEAAVAIGEALNREVSQGRLKPGQKVWVRDFIDGRALVACQPLARDLRIALSGPLRRKLDDLGTPLHLVEEQEIDATAAAVEGRWRLSGSDGVVLSIQLADISGTNTRRLVEQPWQFNKSSVSGDAEGCLLSYQTINRTGKAPRSLDVLASADPFDERRLHEFAAGDMVKIVAKADGTDWLVVELPVCSEPGRARCFGFAQATLEELLGDKAPTTAEAPRTRNIPGPGRPGTTQAAPALLLLDSVPSGAEVWRDGQKLGETPRQITGLRAGDRVRVELRYDLYATRTIELELAAGFNEPPAVVLEPTFGSLLVEPEPANAAIRLLDLQGRPLRELTTPLTEKLAEGAYLVELSRAGYEPRRQRVTVLRGESARLTGEEARLRRLEGQLVVTSEPLERGAKVVIAGKEVGTVPLELVLPAGEHEIEVTGKKGVGKAKVKVDDNGYASAVVPLKSGPQVGDTFDDCGGAGWCPRMVVVPAGSFMIGSSDAERAWAVGQGAKLEWLADEQPHHRVTVAKPFAVGRYEVTFEEWDACVKDGGCGGYRPGDNGWGRGRQPVINVSWNDAKAYVAWLSRKTGQPYRLLSEAEWEYAARGWPERQYVATAGTTPFWTGTAISTEQANYDGNYTYGSGRKATSRNRTVAVDDPSFPANPFGLYHVHGNVREWVEDCYRGSYEGAPSDGRPWTDECPESGRVARGGSWSEAPWYLRSALRLWFQTDRRMNNTGFRIARTLG